MANQAAVRQALTDISANVSAEKTVIGSVETLLANLAQKIADLTTAVQNADVPQDIVDQVTALGQAIDSNRAQLAQDVVTNTPAG